MAQAIIVSLNETFRQKKHNFETKMYKSKFIIIILCFLLFFCLPTYAKKKYTYENGILLDIKIGQEYSAFGGVCSQYGCTGGQGGSRDIYYPIIKVGEIAYLGKTKTKLNDLIVGQTLKVRFNKDKTTIYLTDSYWDSGVEIIKKAKL